VLAAHRAGVKTIILPELNRKDIEGLPKKVQKDIRFHCVTKMLDVLKIALETKKTRRTRKRRQKK
jgi:ATP-dependent Lon protease